MTVEERERKIQSLMDGTEKFEDSISILYVDGIIPASQKKERYYMVRLREEGNPAFYSVSLPHKVFEGLFENKAMVDNPKNLAVIVKKLKSAEFGIILDADGWKVLREKCIQRANSSSSKRGSKTYTLMLQEIEDIFLMYAGNFEEE